MNPDEDHFEEIKLGLQTNHLIRTPKQVNTILSYMRSLSFFQNNILPVGEDIAYKTCECMTYELYNTNNYVCRIGDPGEKFYVILKGTVRVLVSSPQNEDSLVEVNQLADGKSFGEYALLHNQPRIASIQAVVPAHLAVLNKENYLGILGRIESKRTDEIVRFLRRFTVFKKWGKHPIIKISYFFTERTLPRKTVLFKENEQANEIILIKQGELELSKAVKSEKESKMMYFRSRSPPHSANVAILGPGETVGEEILTSSTHLYTCKVYSFNATILIMSREDFYRRVRNEESQNALLSETAMKEQERNLRLTSARLISSSQSVAYREEMEKKGNWEGNRGKKTMEQAKTPLGGEKRARMVSESDVVHSEASVIGRSVVVGERNKEGGRTAFSPAGRTVKNKGYEQKYLYPIQIERKRIFNRDGRSKFRVNSTDVSSLNTHEYS
jgi:CRP-like cAMP-binding protein